MTKKGHKKLLGVNRVVRWGEFRISENRGKILTEKAEMTSLTVTDETLNVLNSFTGRILRRYPTERHKPHRRCLRQANSPLHRDLRQRQLHPGRDRCRNGQRTGSHHVPPGTL